MKSCNKGFGTRGFSTQTACLLATVLAICLRSAASETLSVTIAWNPGSDSDIAGYAFYHGTTNGSNYARMDVGTNTSAVVSGLVPGQTNYFEVSAYNTAYVEGTRSTALPYIVPGYLGVSSGSGLNLTFPVSPGHYYVLEASTNLTNLASWSNIWQTSTESSNAWISYQDLQAGSYKKRFYRLILH